MYLISSTYNKSESEALDVEFVELSEEPQDFKEIIELAPIIEGSSDEANVFRT